MTIETLVENRKTRKKKEVVDGNVPLLPKAQETNVDYHEFNRASFSGAVFNLSTTVIGAGIMGLPACVRKLGMVPGLLAIILTALLTEKSIEFVIRFSRAGNLSSYGSLMGDAFGKYGKISVEICIVIGNTGMLIVYMIIVGDVISGTTSSGIHHPGILEGWFGVHWWTGRTFVLVFATLAVFAPLVSFKRIDSLRFTSALSVGLAVVFLIIAVGISTIKIISGGIEIPRLFPIITDVDSVFDLFTVAPVLMTAYICHFNVHSIDNELEDSSRMSGVVCTSLTLCSSVYLLTSFFGFLLFGEGVLDDVLANFDTDLGIPFGSALNDAVRLSYAAHLVLVFPVIFYALRVNLDGLIFSSSRRPLVVDNFRFASITISLVGIIFLGANFIPNIWVIFQFTGATGAVCVGFVFPAAITLRDRYNIATKTDKILAVLMIVLAVFSNAVAIYSDASALINKN
ncbi:putative amino acid transporter, transmembrane domain-containing protein [Medicago truncatula]|uniref:Putative amino acid transporter, transmembrane domain-containing protein n=1 Tax=Medicago truncatula TaxID=3880 RepID=A0A072U622_MEDTR|nr:amino acid transporter AVT6B [Medicago truncatula]XP_024641238.1 amino acid transporter AVT6B [Medicago truncatula]XP_024641239.1 amino acid transporter AVT6B [Medicago truncatula]XP_024641240.1 amino acid transporter AVT6B [Medicago truncatula]XP_039691078.1 amino acid transporter AVT6B [Medicago truncatula]KEH25199.1 transmembrane amino acid transporter family protein [Medicago truncatula]RHN50303.1 putative amino acid transporter, transmembrane domain-containing protein [Medicago trunca